MLRCRLSAAPLHRNRISSSLLYFPTLVVRKFGFNVINKQVTRRATTCMPQVTSASRICSYIHVCVCVCWGMRDSPHLTCHVSCKIGNSWKIGIFRFDTKSTEIRKANVYVYVGLVWIKKSKPNKIQPQTLDNSQVGR